MLLQARFKESETLLQKAIQTYRRERGDVDSDVARCLNRLGALYIDTNQIDLAEKCLTEALAIRRELLGPTHSRVGQTLKNMYFFVVCDRCVFWLMICSKQRMNLAELKCDHKAALEYGLQALAIQETELGHDDIRLMSSLNALGRLYMEQVCHEEENPQNRLSTLVSFVCVSETTPRRKRRLSVHSRSVNTPSVNVIQRFVVFVCLLNF